MLFKYIFSGSYVYFQLFHFNGNENNLLIAIKVKLLNLYRSLIKMLILEENFRWHSEAFASELFIYNTFY